MVKQSRGQALVEFALVAPVVLLLIGATVDMGRGLLLYALLQGASRDTARQATQVYYTGSNTLPPACTTLPRPCTLKPLITSAHLLDPLGVKVVYADSGSLVAPPGYGLYAVNPDRTQPGTIALAGVTTPNTVYVFIYEIDSTPGNPNPRWGCVAFACVNAPSGSAFRTSGHQRVVVDLKLRWQPVLARFLGIPASITIDSQTVDRMEF